MLLTRQVSDARDEHIDMTPMVDVVFQLMTFMLFSTQMTGGEKVQVPPARHGVGVEESAATFITLMKPTAAGRDSRVVLGNGGGPETSIADLRKAITKGVRDGKRKVVLQADGAVPHGDVLKLIGEVSDIEGITIHIGVQEDQ